MTFVNHYMNNIELDAFAHSTYTDCFRSGCGTCDACDEEAERRERQRNKQHQQNSKLLKKERKD